MVLLKQVVKSADRSIRSENDPGLVQIHEASGPHISSHYRRFKEETDIVLVDG